VLATGWFPELCNFDEVAFPGLDAALRKDLVMDRCVCVCMCVCVYVCLCVCVSVCAVCVCGVYVFCSIYFKSIVCVCMCVRLCV